MKSLSWPVTGLSEIGEGAVKSAGPVGGTVSSTVDRLVAGAPAQFNVTATYKGSPTVAYAASNDQSSWTTLTDNSGLTWANNGSTAAATKVATFADGSTTYRYYRVTVTTTTGPAPTVDSTEVFHTFVPSITANLHTNLSAARNVYSDTGATTAQFTDGGAVKAWTDLTATKVFSNATGALLKRSATFGHPAIQFCDDPSSPSAYYYLDRASHFSAALNTAFTCYVVASKPAARTNESNLVATSASLQFRLTATDDVVTANCFSLVSPQVRHTDDAYQGVYSAAFDGSVLTTGYNKQINGTKFGTSIGFGTENCRLGNYNGTSTYAHCGWIYTVLMYSAAHTRTQQETIMGELMAFYGDTQTASVLCIGNSITAGFLTYTNPYPSQLSSYMTSPFIVTNRATAGWLTSQVADDLIGAPGVQLGNGTYMYNKTLGGTPTRTSVDVTTTPFGSEQGNIAWMHDGTQKGYGAVVDAGNDSDTLPLVSPGFPSPPAAGDVIRLGTAGLASNYVIAIPWEMTNDLKTNGATDGPTANLTVKSVTPVYQRFIGLCNTLRAMGFKVIVPTMLPRNDAGLPTDFQTDWGILNGWIRTDYASYGDVLADVNTLVQFENVAAITTYSSYWIDNVHPSNTGGAVLAQFFASLIEGIIP